MEKTLVASGKTIDLAIESAVLRLPEGKARRVQA